MKENLKKNLGLSFQEVVTYLVDKHGGNVSEISRQLGLKSDGKPHFSSQLIGQYLSGETGKKGPNMEFVERWEKEYGENIIDLMKNGLSAERKNERVEDSPKAPELYKVIVDTMQHILDQNTNLINQRQNDIDKLHVDKEKLYKEKEWMYSHIDNLTAKIKPLKDS